MSVSLVKAPTGNTWREIIGDEGRIMDSAAGMLWFKGDDLPDIGGTAYLGDFDRSPATWRDLQDVPYVIVPFTVWGDYTGDAVCRSNARSLVRDFPESFVVVSGGYGSEMLVVPADATPNEHIAEMIRGLADYPLIDEDDHSALTNEVIVEDWPNYLHRDTSSDVATEFGLDDMDVSWDIDDVMSADDMLQHLWEFYSNADESPYMESAVSVVFPFPSECVRYIVGKVHDAVLAAYGYGTPVQSETLDVHV